MDVSHRHEKISSNQSGVDFDIHGLVRVRLIDATAREVAALADRLGPPRPLTNQVPDITIRFKERWVVPGLKYIGLNSAGFTDEGFYLLHGKSGQVEARIPFEQIGNSCEIVCQSGLGSVPLLLDIIHLTLLRKNFLPIHAAAFLYNGLGILVMGWTKGGKTETLLAFATHGAQYIGDEWVVLSGDGQIMFGIPTPITLWEWQFPYIPKLLPRISTPQKILFKIIHVLEGVQRTWGQGRLKSIFPSELLSRVLPALKRQLKIVVMPQALFKDGLGQRAVTPDKLFLVLSHSEPGITIEPCQPAEIAQRMRHSNQTEQMPFFEYYQAFRFAFPHLQNEFLEQVNDLQSSLLCRALAGKEAYKVCHPYPVSLESLFNQLQPFCQKK